MKLTTKQMNELLGCHIGVGFIAYKIGEDTITKFEFYTGKDNKVRKISDFKTEPIDFQKEITKDLEFK